MNGPSYLYGVTMGCGSTYAWQHAAAGQWGRVVFDVVVAAGLCGVIWLAAHYRIVRAAGR